jgi:hypothetical protein
MHNLFHSERYKQVTYTILYDGREGYSTVVHLDEGPKEEHFNRWKNAEQWALKVIDEISPNISVS